MPDPEHLAIATRGADEWNEWRKFNPGVVPDLGFLVAPQKDFKGFNLKNANLEEANLNRANLEETDIEGANLKNAKCARAQLAGAVLKNANLDGANFENADFTGAQLAGADLKDAKLFQCNFERADLSTAKNLKWTQLARSKLSHAILPPNLNFQELSLVEETSKNARTLSLTLLVACIYCWLTIASTEHVDLLVNNPSKSGKLPIIDVSIPLRSFFEVAPALLAFVFFYLHLYRNSPIVS